MSSRNIDQTYYEILEVATSADHHTVVAAYQRAKEAYSADSPALYTMFTKEEADEIRKLVEEAYLILGNQTKRKEYDALLLARNRKSTELQLPDFKPLPNVKKIENSNAAPAAQTPSVGGTIPQGFAKSRLSVYEINQEIETEIASQSTCDGAFLRKVRQYKNVNIDQLSKETRIGRGYIMAVESDDFEALPAPVFLRGFILQIARVLGLDENKVTTSYMARIKKPE